MERIQKRQLSLYLPSLVLLLSCTYPVSRANSVGGLWTRLGTYYDDGIHPVRFPREGFLFSDCLQQCVADPLCAYVNITQETNECTSRTLVPAPAPADITAFLAIPGHVILQKCRPIRNCADAYLSGFKQNGVAVVCPTCHKGGNYIGECFHVHCNHANGGGWTVFQNRYDGSVSFARPWADYKAGFGDLNGEFWWGNDKLHQLVSDGSYELFVMMTDISGTTGWAHYEDFSIAGESDNYRLAVSGFTGSIYDGMHNGMMFSTNDRDNDVMVVNSCANKHGGAGWWWADCGKTNLNGQYYPIGVAPVQGQGLHWYGLPSVDTWNQYSLNYTLMELRPKDFKDKLKV